MPPALMRAANAAFGADGAAPQSRLADARLRRIRRLIVDRLGYLGVAAAGVGVALAVLWMMAFLVLEAWPLTRAAAVREARTVAVPGVPPGAVLCDEYRSVALLLGGDGVLRVRPLDDHSVSDPSARPIVARPAFVGQTGTVERPLFIVGAGDGRLGVVPVGFRAEFTEGGRRVAAEIGETIWLEPDPSPAKLLLADAWMDPSGSVVGVALTADGHLTVIRRSVRRTLLTGAEDVHEKRSEIAVPRDVTALALGPRGGSLFGGTESGGLYWWSLGADAEARVVRESVGSTVRTLTFLLGGRALVAGLENGGVQVWLPLEGEQRERRLARIRELGGHTAPIVAVAPSMRDRSFLALDAGGQAALHYSTTGRTLWRGEVGAGPRPFAYFAPRGDGALVWGEGGLRDLHITNPHPEATVAALFGRVWYESYEQAAFVWQSSSASDDFEPKLSLVPLIVGTLKGTLYSLLLAVPAAILAAIYVSHFMSRGLRDLVKPVIEILAALPSVVLGFLAGLWLASRLEQLFPAFLAMMLILPVLAVAAGVLTRRFPASLSARLPRDWEVFAVAVLLALGVWVSIELSEPLSRVLFGGSFSQWIYRRTGTSYEQRNALVVGIAMGFAVIPVIFSVAEEALSNVPATLVSGARALGANLWQTVTGVVLPAAAPGIFSAVMLGFGRAVGETMIVLMASGNTPILDWSPFNGLRTLSANIAVEIPEAPQASTLYRTLFVSALLLFVVTFVINTAAEVIRHRLRTRLESV